MRITQKTKMILSKLHAMCKTTSCHACKLRKEFDCVLSNKPCDWELEKLEADK